MKKYSFIFLIVWACSVQSPLCQDVPRDERMKWWREARFGMFIHWGVYARLAGNYKEHKVNGIGEWIMNYAKIAVSDYRLHAKGFNPVKFNADEWVRKTKAAGMKYIVITAKHHDGFALFKSSASKWNIVDATMYGKDVLKPLAAACKKYGVKLGFYYSQAQDWTNPGGSVARMPAAEGWANPESKQIDAYTLQHDGHWDPAQETKNFDQYINDVAAPQIKELLTNYGNVDVLWWDTPYNMTDEAALKLQALLKLQPNIITNNRLKHSGFPGDTKTPEQKIPTHSELDGKDWETCMTMNDTWGYKSWDNNWKSTKTLIQNLCDIASKGGNYLLNVGPKEDGTFPRECISRLKEMGDWMKMNGEAIYATKASPLLPLPWGRCTKKTGPGFTTLYFAVFDWPVNGSIIIPGLKNEIISASLLENKQRLKTETIDYGIEINLPGKALNPFATVIKLELKGMVE